MTNETTPRIVVATDGSPEGGAAVEAGLELARSAGAVATVVYVRHRLLPMLGDAYRERTLSVELHEGRVAVEEAVARAAQAGVAAEPEILEGDPAKKIVELARLLGARMIVVGSRGLGTVAETLLGSVSSAVVHGADRPVLVVRPGTRPLRLAA